MSGGIRNINFTITSDAVHADLDLLLRILHDMRRTSGVHEADSAEEWRKVSAKFDSLMEGAEAMAIKREKLEELSPSEPSLKRKYMEDDLSMRDLLKHRERMHMKELTSNRGSINSLIDGKIKLAESFKSCISILCRERDYYIRELKEEIADLQEQLEKSRHGIRAPVNVIAFRKTEEEVSDDEGDWDRTDEEILARFKAAKAKYDAQRSYIFIDRQKDEEYLAKFYGVDRRPLPVDRQVDVEDVIKYTVSIEGDDDFASTSDEEDFIAKFIIPEDEAKHFEEQIAEQVKYIGLWKSTAVPEPEVATMVQEEPKEEEGKPQPIKVLEKDNTMEALFFDCIVDDVNKPLGLCQLDTGAAVNVTSMEVINRLGVSYTKGDVGFIELLGGDIMKIQGVAENVTLRMGDALVKVDLHIINVGDNRSKKTILGTGFMRSVGAVIDFDARRVTFNKINPNKHYHWVTVPKNY